MEFVPNIKPKRRRPKFANTKPFPTDLTAKLKALFSGFSVQVFDEAQLLHEQGYYGKIRRVPETSNSTDYKESLVLDLEEAFLLAYVLDVIEIVDIENTVQSRKQIFQKFLTIKEHFAFTLAAYIYLKSKGWVVKPGLKFGGDFLLYKQGMPFHHASFIVHVSCGERTVESKDVQGMQRVAEASDKDVLLLSVHAPPDIAPAEFYDYIHTFSVTETIPRRFEFKKHVQNKQNST